MFNKIWNHLVRMQEIRAAEFALRSMTDSQLKDIGVTRCEIKRIASQE